jgi:hypothetical protein
LLGNVAYFIPDKLLKSENQKVFHKTLQKLEFLKISKFENSRADAGKQKTPENVCENTTCDKGMYDFEGALYTFILSHRWSIPTYLLSNVDHGSY